jgi:hypothetical protein
MDDLVRDAIADVRAFDQREAPAFEDIVTRRTAPGRARSLWVVPALAAAVILIAVGVRARAARRDRLVVPQEVVALTAWRAATDGLLDTHVKPLLTGAPALGASLIDTALPTGDSR